MSDNMTLHEFETGQRSPENGNSSGDSPSEPVDSEEVVAVRCYRALTDPVIFHKRSMGYGPGRDNPIYGAITQARLRAAVESDTDRRIELATWPEVATYCMSASGDAGVALQEPFVATYERALEITLREYLGFEDDPLPPGPIDATFDTRAREMAEALRRKIKASLDATFLESRYSEVGVEGIPRSFWE